jgi:hypothetical protein
MDKPIRVKGVFIDFDGVISRNAVEHIISFVHGYMNLHTLIAPEFVRAYIKNISCFPVDASARLLFDAFGIEDQLDDFFSAFKKFGEQPENLRIERDFHRFLEFCQNKNIEYKILSLANPGRIKAACSISEGDIYPLNNRSKANQDTFSEIGTEMEIDLKKWAYIEDNPVALQAAKQSGLNTIMMLNNIYTEADYSIFKDYIDFKVDSFDLIAQLEIF